MTGVRRLRVLFEPGHLRPWRTSIVIPKKRRTVEKFYGRFFARSMLRVDSRTINSGCNTTLDG